MKKFLAFLLVTGMFPAIAISGTRGGVEIDKDAQAVDFTHVTNVSGYSMFSVQAVYEDASPATATISDGNFSSATLTVADYTALDGQGASGTLTLQDGKNTSAIDLAIITLGSKQFIEGTNWDRLTTSTMTMNSLKEAIDADWEYAATVSSNVVTVTYFQVGTSGNSYALTSSTAAAITASAATLSGGLPYAYVNINGTTLTEGTDWDAETSSATTAINIKDAVNSDSTLSAIITASTQAVGVVRLLSDASGHNPYYISVSSYDALTPSNGQFVGGEATDISVSGDTFTESTHGFSDGLAVLFSTAAGTAPTGLTNATTYYVIKTDANTFQVSDTSTGAVAGLDIDITAVTGGGSFTFAPLAFSAGSLGFKWQGSNDGTNFSDVDVSSVTYSADGNDIFSFVDYAYKYLRLNFTGPDTGGLDFTATIFGRD